MLTRDDILARGAIRTREIEVTQLGGAVSVRDITLLELGQVMEQVQKCPEDERLTQKIIRVVALGLVEPQLTADEIGKLNSSCEIAVYDIFQAITNGAGPGKNSPTVQTVSNS